MGLKIPPFLPAFLHDHPVESLLAALLLAGLLFISADGTVPLPAAGIAAAAAGQKN